jgi:hypothetical protein
MKKIIITSLFLSALFAPLKAQKAVVGVGTSSPQTVLDVVSNRNGILIPRQTALQITNIQNPQEAELVYSLTDDDVTVNEKGFWFFHSGTWLPLLDNNANTNSIYTADGIVNSNRIVIQNGNFLDIGPGLFYIDGATSRIGLLTNAPTQALDVNGEVRIQTLNSVGNVVADAQGTLLHDTAEFFDIGDIKPSYNAADHDGWYLLDGRAITSLPQTAQDNATTILGITTSLPDASGRYSIGTTATPGGFTGNNMITLTRSNLPSFNFTYTTNLAGAHSHTFTYQTIRTNTANGGGNNIHAYWLSGAFVGGGNYPQSTTGFHFHSYTAASGGSSTPVDIRPSALNANYFVYLGQ